MSIQRSEKAFQAVNMRNHNAYGGLPAMRKLAHEVYLETLREVRDAIIRQVEESDALDQHREDGMHSSSSVSPIISLFGPGGKFEVKDE